MAKLTFDISMSLDGFVAGPNQRLEEPLGDGGEQLHEWVLRLASWREAHGREGGERGVDDEVVEETVASAGAIVMGRNMLGGGGGRGGAGPWPGWWGDAPPFHVPVFVLTHHAREPLTLSDTTFTFVTDGIESALEQARAAAGDLDVLISGGASVIGQTLGIGRLDELNIHVAPVLLGDGTPL